MALFSRIKLIKCVAVYSVSLASLSATAGLLEPSEFEIQSKFRGSVSFTPKEIQTHLRHAEGIARSAFECLEKDLNHHKDFFSRHGISPFYGDQSAFSKMTLAQKKAHLVELGKDPALLAQMQPTSCVGLSVKCLGQAFERHGQGEVWKRIKNFTAENAYDGTAMQSALQLLGWRLYYWNPDTAQVKAWDEAEQKNDPGNARKTWGYHEYRWSMVRRPSRTYYKSVVDDIDVFVNFGKRPPKEFKDVPFYVGTAHAGYHVFPGGKGHVIEGHSRRKITDPSTLEDSEFNPLAWGGGPRGQYFNGMIAIPPGFEL